MTALLTGVCNFAFTKDSGIVTSNCDGCIRFWNVAAGSAVELGPKVGTYAFAPLTRDVQVASEVGQLFIPGGNGTNARAQVVDLTTSQPAFGKRTITAASLLVAGRTLAALPYGAKQFVRFAFRNDSWMEEDSFGEPNNHSEFGLSEDGRLLVSATDSELVGWDLSLRPAVPEWRTRIEVAGLGRPLRCPFQLSLDARWLAVRCLREGKPGLRFFDLGSVPPVAAGWIPDGGIRAYAFCPHTHTVLYANNSRIRFVDVSGPVVTQLFSQPMDDPVRWLAFHPSSRMFAVCTDNGRVELRRTSNGELVKAWKFPALVGWVGFATDGRHLFTHNSNSTVYVLRMTDLDGIPPSAQ